MLLLSHLQLLVVVQNNNVEQRCLRCLNDSWIVFGFHRYYGLLIRHLCHFSNFCFLFCVDVVLYTIFMFISMSISRSISMSISRGPMFHYISRVLSFFQLLHASLLYNDSSHLDSLDEWAFSFCNNICVGLSHIGKHFPPLLTCMNKVGEIKWWQILQVVYSVPVEM